MDVVVWQLKQYSWAAILTATVVGCLVWAQPHANLTATALALVLVVTVSAIAWGSGPALITALLSVFGFNYFFIPPIHTFTIAEPQNWIAFVVFVATAVAVGQLSSRARNRAEEAEARRIEIERLYRQLTDAVIFSRCDAGDEKHAGLVGILQCGTEIFGGELRTPA